MAGRRKGRRKRRRNFNMFAAFVRFLIGGFASVVLLGLIFGLVWTPLAMIHAGRRWHSSS